MAVVDVVISIATKVAEYLVEPAILQGKYFLCANKVIQDLKNEEEELASERNSLQVRVQQAKERAEEIEKPVEIWLNDVDNLLAQAADLEQRMTANNSCLQGRFPTWRRYRLCKQMARKKEEMGKVKGKSNIQPFSHPAPLPGIQYESSENFTYFESTKLAYNQLLEALQDESVYMIGVYGMGGLGKTTLVTEVGKKAEELKLFEKAIKITVSQTPNIKEIQGKMADMLSMSLREESEDGRAQRLWMCLKEKRALIIVDDLWEEFDLSKIGIRLDNGNKGIWKILVTTRSRDICVSMSCQKQIHLGLLTEDESWTLFKNRANIDDGISKSLKDVPREICDQCGRLPIAIVTVGSSLKGKHISVSEWQVALHSLKHSQAIHGRVHGGVGKTFAVFEWSYNYLRSSEAKVLFLMCSLFPEDRVIKKEDLVRYAIGLRQGRTSSLEYERSCVETDLKELIDCCLLIQDEERKECVKMHDLVRDAALWIANRSEDHKMLVNFDKPLGTMAEDVNISDFYAVSSWYNENQFCLQWDAPKLEILLLNTEIPPSGSMDLSQEKLEGKEGLRILAIINWLQWYSPPPPLSLPQLIKLRNLRTLRLEGWSLGDISFIECLERLEALHLKKCTFSKLPDEIGKLQRLKLLELSECGIEENYNGAIGKCVKLEELYFTGIESNDLFIQSIVTLPNLNRFVICTAFSSHLDLTEGAIRRLLEIRSVDNILKIGESNKNLLQKVEILILKDLRGGCKNIIPDMNGVVEGMNDLAYLFLEEIEDLECIFDHTASASQHELVALFPKLVTLTLRGMANLTELCRGQPQQVLHMFENLEKLDIRKCPQLRSIFPSECNLGNLKILEVVECKMLGEALFSMSAAQSLTQLEELHIDGCDELKHIIARGRECGTITSNKTPSSSHSMIMPRLKDVRLTRCSKLKSLFPICCVEGLARLQKIEIYKAPELEYVFGECDDKDHSSHQYQNQVIMLPPLDHLLLRYLPSLIGICPENYNVKWPSVRELSVVQCPQFTKAHIAMMVGSEQRHHHLNQDQQKHSPSKLQQLLLLGLPQLKLISCMGPTPTQILSLHCLQKLKVFRCENLKSLFSIVAHKSLPELRTLHIRDCHELEQIISEDEEAETLSNAQVFFPKLMQVIVISCNKLRSIFPSECNLGNLKILYVVICKMLGEALFSMSAAQSLTQLEELRIEGCDELKHIIASGRESGTISSNKTPSSSHSMIMPRLMKVELKSCSKLKSLFPICCVEGLARLQKIEIYKAPELEYVFGECDDKDHSSHQYQNQVIMLPPLDHLLLRYLPSLIGICPENYNVKWPSVRELSVVQCPQFTKAHIAMMVGSEQRHHHLNQDQQKHSPSKLQLLQLSGLPQLKLISCIGPTPTQILSLHCLQMLEVGNCNYLKCLFSIAAHGSLPELRTLEISECQELEQIISEDEEAETLSNAQVFFPKLMEIKVRNCNKLRSIFPSDCNLGNLKILQIDECKMLGEALFSMSAAQSLTQLEQLRICGCDELKHIIASGRECGTITSNKTPSSSHSMIMPRLKDVRLTLCSKLKSLFPICCVEGLARLQMIEIFEAPELEYVFGECDDKDHSSHQYQNQVIMLPPLDHLLLRYLPSLIGICPENYNVKWPSVRELSVVQCPQFTKAHIAMMVGSEQRHHHLNQDQQKHSPSKLQLLQLSGLPQLKLISCIGPTPTQILSLHCLQMLEVGNCNYLKCLFSIAAHGSLPELRTLEISECQELEQIISEDEEAETLSNAQVFFPKLMEIKVRNCNKLRSIFPSDCNLGNLKILQIDECKMLGEALFSMSAAQSLTQLEQLRICGCDELKHIIASGRECGTITSNKTPSSSHSMIMPRLKDVRLTLCSKLKSLFPICCVEGLARLQMIEIFEAPELEYVFGECDDKNHSSHHYEELYIRWCPQLRSIFPSECTLGNLKILHVVECKMLGEALFSMSAAQSLTQLEELRIEGCDELKHIIASGRECGTISSNKTPSSSHSMIMPRLMKVELKSCSKLKSLFPICCVEGLARLQKIEIYKAPELEYVFGECDDKDHSSHQYQNQVIMLPPLDHLLLRYLPSLIGICPENYNVKWPSVRELSVVQCPQFTKAHIAMMVGSEQRHHHLNQDQQKHSPSKLQQLELRGLPQLKLISCIGPTPTQILSLHCLQELEVYECKNLKCLFSIVAHRSLPELRTLEISGCLELEQIISEDEEAEPLSNAQVFFPKLMEITVENCNKLKSLFSVAMVRMLPQLSFLHISEATQLEEVFTHGRGDDTVNGMEIVLPNLTKVKLKRLPNFVDICQGFELQVVKLQHLDIYECPKIAPSLREIQVDGDDYESDWDGDEDE